MERNEQLLLGGFWGACEGVLKGKMHFRLSRWAAFFYDALGEYACGFDVRWVIEQNQGLQGGVAVWPLGYAFFPRRRIKSLEAGVNKGPFPEGVESATIQFFAVVLFILVGVPDAFVGVGPVSFGLVWLYTFAADLSVKQAGDGQGIISNEFSRKAKRRLMGEQAIEGVACDNLWCGDGLLLVRVRGGDEGNHMFHVPAAFHELDREPVEQLGMGGPFTLITQVVEDIGEACAEEQIPQSIHLHACGEGILWTGDPVCEVEAVGAFSLIDLSEECRNSGLHDFAAGVHPVATVEYAHGAGFAHRLGDKGIGATCIDGFDCLVSLGNFLFIRFVLLEFGQRLVCLLECFQIVGVFEDGHGGLEDAGAAPGADEVGLFEVGKECGKRVIIFDGEGVEFVIMAFATHEGSTEPDGGGISCLVRQVLCPVFFGLCAAFAGHLVHAVVSGRDKLGFAAVFDQVAAELVARELVVGEVVVKRINDVVAIGRGEAFVVGMKPHGVGPADEVEPVNRHAFAVVRGL